MGNTVASDITHHPAQLKLYESPGERAYLQYTEDISKTNQGGLKHRKEPKVVVQYANELDPTSALLVCTRSTIRSVLKIGHLEHST